MCATTWPISYTTSFFTASSSRDRVAGGDRPHLGTEQAKLKGMLGSGNAPAPWGGESDPTASIGVGQSDRGFLGMRYALACWLDEILIDAGWREWDENKLESALYRTNIRYSNFWNQARLADAIPSAVEAQEVFLLCVLLGFRGEMGEQPEKLASGSRPPALARHARPGQGPARVAAEEPGDRCAAARGCGEVSQDDAAARRRRARCGAGDGVSGGVVDAVRLACGRVYPGRACAEKTAGINPAARNARRPG